jgi:hypothetical protein
MKQHFVIFYSPGTMFAEQSEYKIDRFDVDLAVEQAKHIVERHNATPYGFQFITRERGPDDLDSHVSYRSGMYFLGGEILTLDELRAQNNEDDSTLINNMICNNYDRVIINTNSWKWTQPFTDRDQLVEFNNG